MKSNKQALDCIAKPVSPFQCAASVVHRYCKPTYIHETNLFSAASSGGVWKTRNEFTSCTRRHYYARDRRIIIRMSSLLQFSSARQIECREIPAEFRWVECEKRICSR